MRAIFQNVPNSGDNRTSGEGVRIILELGKRFSCLQREEFVMTKFFLEEFRIVC